MDTATTIREAVATLPVVVSADMLRAQAYVPTREEFDRITKAQDVLEAAGAGRRLSLKVVDFRGHTIGSLRFQ